VGERFYELFEFMCSFSHYHYDIIICFQIPAKDNEPNNYVQVVKLIFLRSGLFANKILDDKITKT
jgi:hypothetical protein